jgi:predicted enzyme related to lactoylglutathione lyase
MKTGPGWDQTGDGGHQGTAGTEEGATVMSAPFMWFDLVTADTGRAGKFYSELFDWNVADAGVGGYQAWITGEAQPWAGIVAATPGSAGGWLPYVVVDDLAGATARATSLGAKVVSEASDGPAGTSVTIADPGGAHLALFKPFPPGN